MHRGLHRLSVNQWTRLLLSLSLQPLNEPEGRLNALPGLLTQISVDQQQCAMTESYFNTVTELQRGSVSMTGAAFLKPRQTGWSGVYTTGKEGDCTELVAQQSTEQGRRSEEACGSLTRPTLRSKQSCSRHQWQWMRLLVDETGQVWVQSKLIPAKK